MNRFALALVATTALSGPAWAQVATGPNVQIGTTTGTAYDGAAGAADSLKAAGAVQAAGGNSSATVSTATGGTSSRALSDQQADRLNILSYAAAGTSVDQTGATDISAALSSAVAKVNSLSSAGTHACIYFPAGRYYVNAAVTQFSINVPGCVVGDGNYKTFVTAGPNFSGSMFSWSEAWGLAPLYAGTYATGAAWNGPSVHDLTINGTLTSSNTQAALTFYDRNDFVNVENVSVFYMNGGALSIGTTKNQPAAYMRESHFKNFTSWSSGSPSLPAVSISSVGSGSGGDATNELNFFDTNIIASLGKGLVINNNYTSNTTRLLKFTGLRVESSKLDQITIGDPVLTGQVTNLTMTGLDVEGTLSGYHSVLLTAPALSSAPININMDGLLGSGAGTGLEVDAGSVIRWHGGISVSGTSVVVGASSLVGYPITLDGDGGEYLWSSAIDSTSLPNIRIPTIRTGLPSGGSVSVLANVHDGTAGRGVAVGSGGVDLSSYRYAASQAASGAYSTIGGGENNAAIGGDSVVCGGNANTASGFRSTSCGGYGNNINGSYAGHAGGFNNVLTGTYSGGVGGAYASDTGRYGWFGFASGDIASTGDAQIGYHVLRGTGSSTTAIRLTADGATAGGSNCVNVGNSKAYSIKVSLHARDFTTAGSDYDWMLPQGEMTRDATASTTAISLGTPTTVSRGTVTGAGVTAAADTTNGCLNLSFTPPSANTTDVWHVVARVDTVEVQ